MVQATVVRVAASPRGLGALMQYYDGVWMDDEGNRIVRDKWRCYCCHREVEREHIFMVLSNMLKIGRCKQGDEHGKVD